MSDESLKSVPAVEGGQCSFEDLVCVDRPEDHYDQTEQLCSAAPIVPTMESEYFAHVPFKTLQDNGLALVNRSKHFKSKPKKIAKKPDEPSVASKEISGKQEKTIQTQESQVAEALTIQYSSKQRSSEDATEDVQSRLLVVPVSVNFLCACLSLENCFGSNLSNNSRNGSLALYQPEKSRETSNESIPIVAGAALVPGEPILVATITDIARQSEHSKEIAELPASVISVLPAQLANASFANPTRKKDDGEKFPDEALKKDNTQSSPVMANTAVLSVSDAVATTSDHIGVADFGGTGASILPKPDAPVSSGANPVSILSPSPSLVSPRESNSFNLVAMNSSSTLAHARVEKGSESQTSRDSSQQGGSNNSHSGKHEHPGEEEKATI